MPARVIDGRAVAAALRARVAAEVARLAFRPGLAVVLVGDDPASAVYVRAKDRAATAPGIAARTIRLPADDRRSGRCCARSRAQRRSEVDGILVQLPLPPQIRPRAAIDALDPAKDVDGLTIENVGRLAEGLPGLVPCTPLGVMRLLEAAAVAPRGGGRWCWGGRRWSGARSLRC